MILHKKLRITALKRYDVLNGQIVNLSEITNFPYLISPRLQKSAPDPGML